MIFKIHYFMLLAGINASTILLGVYLEEYTDASTVEIGTLYMIMPFTGLIFRPIICSFADRAQAHKKYLLVGQSTYACCYCFFIILPLLGPEIYREYGRLCWYTLMLLKVVGDIAFGGMVSITDSLAVNYASRTGIEFTNLRVWGTISWMLSGLIVGQVNEVSFLPKYVPAFIILIVGTLISLTLIWLWPDEYFNMVSLEPDHKEKMRAANLKPGAPLFPYRLILTHMKKKIKSLVTGKQTRGTIAESCRKHEIDLSVVRFEDKKRVEESEGKGISKITQLKILAMLMRKDLRISLYLVYFFLVGLAMAPSGFFFMSLSDLCQETGRCHFSKLSGIAQASDAGCEIVFYSVIKSVKSVLGRNLMCALGMLLLTVKWLFYGTIWTRVNPLWVMASEGLQGMAFGVTISLMVETAHLFREEVEYVLPELMERGEIEPNADQESLKLSLAATLQALTACANDGFGRGIGSLICGLFLDKYSYTSLWLIMGIGCGLCFLAALLIKLIDMVFRFNLAIEKPKKLEVLTGPGTDQRHVTQVKRSSVALKEIA